MLRLLTVVGARPQFIKAAAVSRAITASDRISERLVHTGQHYDQNMSQIFFDELAIPPPAHHLGIGGGRHGEQTAAMLEKLEAVMLDEKPDCVLVYGDTNSTLAGALAAAKLHIPVAHVEAGLRSFNRRMPEEINRVVADHVATLLFCPTQAAVDNLRREGITHGVHQVGDVMYDSVLYHEQQAARQSRILQRLDLAPGAYYLATIHRAENTDDPARLHAIFTALGRLPLPVIVPLHPRTRNALQSPDPNRARRPAATQDPGRQPGDLPKDPNRAASASDPSPLIQTAPVSERPPSPLNRTARVSKRSPSPSQGEGRREALSPLLTCSPDLLSREASSQGERRCEGSPLLLSCSSAQLSRAAPAVALPPHVRLIDPLPYLDLLMLEKHARAILTDSGGVQKEACFFGVPCITLRDETEWIELIDAGVNVLAGADTDRIIAAVDRLADRPPAPPIAPRLYGNGRAAEMIVGLLESQSQG